MLLRRHRTAASFALVALAVGGGFGALAATAPDDVVSAGAKVPKPKRIRLACALKSDNTLRFVARARGCRARVGTVVRLDPGPAVVCVRKRGTRRGSLKAAAAPRITRQLAACGRSPSSSETRLLLPGARREFFCVEKRSKVMRRSKLRGRCRARGRFAEFRGFVEKQSGAAGAPRNAAPLAEGDRAATDEQSAVAIPVLANDQDPDGDTLAVGALDTAATAGSATADPGGTVGYDPAGRFDRLKPGETATDSFTYTARDPGGATSAPARVEVAIAGVNDAPRVTPGAGATPTFTEGQPDAVTVDPGIGVGDVDSAELTRATVAITAGRQSGETLGFTDSARITGTYDPGTGVLTLTGAASVGEYQEALRAVTFATTNQNPGATRTVEFRVDDGRDASAPATRQVGVTPVNDAPVTQYDSVDGAKRAVGNTSLVVDDPSDGAPEPPGPQKTVTGDILANDADVDGPALSVRAETVSTLDGGAVTLEADGDFTYRPPPHCAGGGDDTFQYTVEDDHPTAELTETAKVTVVVADCVWYVDDDATAGGDGRSDAPYQTLADLDGPGGAGDEDSANHRIFLYDGTYADGMELESGQPLWSEEHGLSVPDGGTGTVVLEPADGAGSEIQGGLRLASGNDVQGVDLGTTGSAGVFALFGTSVGTAHVNDETGGGIDNPAGGAVSIVRGSGTNTLAIELEELSSSGSSTSALALGNANGSFSAAGGTLQAATGTTVSVTGGNADIALAGSVSDNAGQLIQIQNKTGGTNDFDGLVSGGGVSLQSSTGTTRFDGGLALSTTTGAGLTAAGGGTLAVTDPNGAGTAPDNTIATGTGAPLRLTSTAIHADDVTFRSIGSNGATSGIVLDTTGSAGEFRVTGNGTAGSGGTIANSTGPGIALTSVTGGVDLSRMTVQNGGDDGIRGTTVNGLALRNSTVAGNGNAAGESGLDFAGLTGAVTLDADTVDGNADNNVVVVNDSGDLNMTVTNGFYRNTSSSLGNDGILLDATGSGSQTLNVFGNGSDVMFSNNRGDHVQVSTDNSNTVTQNVTITNTRMSSTLGSSTISGGGVSITPGGAATVDASISNNNIQNAKVHAIAVDTVGGSDAQPTTATVDATIDSNTIGTEATARSGSFSGNAVVLIANGGTTVDALVSRNAIRQYTNTHGIQIQQGSGATATMNATLRGNLVANPSDALGGAGGVNVVAGVTATPADGPGPDAGVMCLDLGGSLPNDVGGAGNETGSPDTSDVRVQQAFGTKIEFPQLGPTTTDSAVATYLANRNTVGTGPTVSATSSPANSGFLNRNSACPQPAP
jgi:hypothetical protein